MWKWKWKFEVSSPLITFIASEVDCEHFLSSVFTQGKLKESSSSKGGVSYPNMVGHFHFPELKFKCFPNFEVHMFEDF